MNYIKLNFNKILNNFNDSAFTNKYSFFTSNLSFFNQNQTFLATKDTTILNKINQDKIREYFTNVLPLDVFFKNYTKKTISYDDDGNLIEIDYYLIKYDLDEDGNETTSEIKIKEEKFDYNDDGNIITETINFYYHDWNPDKISNDYINDDNSWYDLIYIKVIDYKYDDDKKLIEEDNSYKLKYKLSSEDDYTEVDLK